MKNKEKTVKLENGDSIIGGKLCDSDGKAYEFVQLGKDDKPEYGAHSMEEFSEMEKSRRTVFDSVSSFFYRIWYRLDNALYAVKYAYQRVRYGFDVRETWSIDYSLMRFIITRVDAMSKNLVGVPQKYCDDARKILVKRGKSGKAVERLEIGLGSKLFAKDLEKLVLDAKLYLYYLSLCVEDPYDFTDGLSKKYPTPKKRGRKGGIDYAAIDKLRVEAKNRVMDYLKENLEILWD